MSDLQNAVIDFLQTLGSDGASKACDVIQTHGAIVFLYPDEAIKIKRAVKYDYLDFSTLELRHKMLLRELELNSPAAPGLYRDVVPITRDPDGALVLDGDGDIVEWALRMARFPTEAEFSVMADRGLIDPDLGTALGRSIATYHSGTPTVDQNGHTLIAEIMEELDRVLTPMAGNFGDGQIDRFLGQAHRELEHIRKMLQDRSSEGWLRRCHGDLHLRNIIIWQGVPTPFDALEFDETLGTCDVLYDLAFLLMDLAHRGLHETANRVLNAYLFHAGADAHLDGLRALPLFLAIRAAIRAMVDVQTSRFAEHPEKLVADAGQYMQQAIRFLAPAPPILLAIGGLSGSGKTTLAHEMAAQIGAFPGAVHLRSDLERKAHFGVDPLDRLPGSAYSPEISAQIYARLRSKARRALAAGHSVILDAVYNAPEERSALQQIATDIGCAFHGLWLEVDTQTRISRVETRKADASDANAEVARQQATLETGMIDWTKLRSGGDLETLARDALTLAKNG